MRLLNRLKKRRHKTIYKTGLLRLLIALVTLSNPLLPAYSEPYSQSEIEIFIPTKSAKLEATFPALQKSLTDNGLDQFKLVPIKYWSTYQRAIRNGKPGVYLAAPHFAAWLIQQHNFKLVAQLTEPLKYVIATRRLNSTLFEINDLGGQKICAHAPLNLDYLSAQKALQSSLVPANIITVRSVRDEMLKQESNCMGFAINDHIFQVFQARDPEQYIRLYQSSSYPNYAFVAGPKVYQSHGKALTKWLSNEATKSELAPILRQFSSKASLAIGAPGNYQKSLVNELKPYWGGR